MGLLLLMGGSDYNVRSELFSQNEQGTYLDPSTYISGGVYQDSNGVTACSAPGDLVGLVLDQRQGALSNLGPELITNGGFDSDIWWTKSTNVTITGGVCQYSSVALNNGVFRSGVVTAGKFYRIEFTVSGFSSGGVRVYLGGTRTTAVSANGTYTYIMPAGSSDTQIIFEATSAGTILALDNVSVREIPGNHAYQSTSGARPTLGRVPFGGRRNLFVYSEDLSNANWAKSTATISGTDTIVLSAGSAAKYVSQSYTGTAPSTISFEAKAGTHRYIQVLTTADVQHFVNIDLTDGVIGTTGTKAEGAVVQDLGDGWRRYRVTITTTGFTQIRFYAADSTSSVYGVSTSSTGSWQLRKIQLETGSTATTYQRVGSTHDVTEAGQPDCWYLDTSGSKWMQTNAIDFNTWTQDTRRNLLTDTESFGLTTWIKQESTVTENSAASPLSSEVTADLLIPSTNSVDTHRITQAITLVNGQSYTLSVYAKSDGTYNAIRLSIDSPITIANFDLQNGVASGGSISSVGNGWYRCSLTFTANTTSTFSRIGVWDTYAKALASTAYAGNGTNGILIWGAQNELGTLTTYQRVGTDEMTVIAGVRKLSDAASGMLCELSATTASNSGSVHITAPRANGEASYGVTLNGAGVIPLRSYTGLAAPRTDVVALAAKTNAANSAAAIQFRLNAQSILGIEVVPGAPFGNFGNYAMFIGARNGVSIFAAIHLFHFIARGRSTTGSKLTGAEKLTARKTGITI